MKALPCILRGLSALAVMLAFSSMAQVACPYPDATLLPSSQTRQVILSSARSAAVVIPLVNPTALIHERNATTGVWSAVQTINGSFTAVAVNREGTHFAIAKPGQIDLYFQASPAVWNNYGTAVVPAGYAVTKLALDGERLVALVDTQGTVVPGGNLVRIYEYNGADWDLTKQITINDTGEFIQLGRESVVSDFSLNGTRLAVSSNVEGCVRIHERDLGSAGSWGLSREITAAGAGVDTIGQSVALSGTRFATSTREGEDIRLDVFSQNSGGANQWGFTGTLITVPRDEIETLRAHVDAYNGWLGVIGTPSLASLSTLTPPQCRAWVFRGVIGGGPGNWMNVADFTVRRPSFFAGPPIGMGFADEDFLYGFGPPSTTNLSAAWLASVHRRSNGGTDGWQLQQTLTGPGSSMRMGRSMAVSGGYVAVGMPDDNAVGIGSGCVMVWYRVPLSGNSVWVPVGRFQASVPAEGANFGKSVAVIDGGGSDDWLAVGAPGENSNRGAVYLFPLNTSGPTTATKRVVASPLDVADNFGNSVSLWSDNHLAVGSPGDDDAGSNAGAVFVYDQDFGGTNNWGQRRKIPRPAGETHPGFGTSIAFTGELLCSALPSMGTATGKIFAYAPDQGGTENWGQISSKTAPAGSPPGFPAALGAMATQDNLLVGAPGNVPAVPGKAYLFGLSASGVWTDISPLGGTAAEGHGFGTAVALSGSRIVIGNPFFGSSGKTFSYDLTTFTVPLTFSLMCTREGSPGDAVGSAVGAMPLLSLSAAPWSDLAGTDAGAVFVDRAGAYEVWAASQGASFTQWLPEEDPDGDGLGNLGEFGMGGNPLLDTSRPPLVMTRTTFTNTSTSFPALRWDRPSLPYSVTGLNYQMRRSLDLVNWTNASPDGGLGFGDPPGRYFRISGERSFFRIEFQYPINPATSLEGME